MSIGQVQALLAFLVCGSLYCCIVARRKRFWHPDVQLIPMAFLAASEMSQFLQLCAYGFFPDPPGVSKLDHLEIYVSGGGLLLLLCSLSTVVTLFAKVIAPRADKTSAALVESEEPMPPEV